MGKSTEIIELLKQAFPGLNDDKDFILTSPDTPNYNCIAWAYQINDRWMWPAPEASSLDGVYYWPDEVTKTPDVNAFIEAFRLKGYECCDVEEYERGYQKIALYVVPNTTECTHAARQLRNGKWTSKLGQLNDIQHGTPHAIEGEEYGVVYCIMKRRVKF